MKQFDKNIVELISRHIPEGKENAKPNKYFRDLADSYHIHMSDIDIRELFAQIRRSIPKQLLAGDGKGYYWCSNPSEAMDYIHSLQGRIEEMQTTHRALQMTYNTYYSKDAIFPDTLKELGFELKEDTKGYDIFMHPKGIVIKQSTTHLGIWAWVDICPEPQPRKLFNKKTKLIEFLKEQGVI